MVSVRACQPKVRVSIYLLAPFLYLLLPPNSQRLPKLLPYCPQTGLTTVYAFEAVAAITSLVLNIFKRKREEKHPSHVLNTLSLPMTTVVLVGETFQISLHMNIHNN